MHSAYRKQINNKVQSSSQETKLFQLQNKSFQIEQNTNIQRLRSQLKLSQTEVLIQSKFQISNNTKLEMLLSRNPKDSQILFGLLFDKHFVRPKQMFKAQAVPVQYSISNE
ncbi:Hypothetical_protein [Hexamita inflata]|uniref:Hypothetical_protein n=1 Tax=Hexamita inflata TaxID=28002 RepID=A0AA86UFN0_9EUKA|nr:Hypothetical protein HINF_LOCUS37606 [Hexamita inflata]CAI9960389.1 Hypothetical protein HINF_LOCUS48034 [Hexamita inflata]